MERRTSCEPDPKRDVLRASHLTVGSLLRNQAGRRPDAVAVDDGTRSLNFREFNDRVNRTASYLTANGVGHGDRVAVCSENRIEYLEIVFAAAKLGVIVSTLNWRLVEAELDYCIALVEPKIIFISPRFAGKLAGADAGVRIRIFGPEYLKSLEDADAGEPTAEVEPEDGLLIIYTSGTTGHPKAALLSHRAELARMLVNTSEFELRAGDAFIAWPPMFHMISMEQCIQVLCLGGTAVLVDGFDPERLALEVETRKIWWLVVMSGMTEKLLRVLRARRSKPAGIRLIGVMADLLPTSHIAELTEILQAPFCNTFGSTETGLPPASAGRLAVAEHPASLAKQLNALCEIRLVDAAGVDVPDGTVGELLFRGPTLFSGYWNAAGVNMSEFRGGWFHMGDMFIRSPDGTLNFADRAKYLIKSGGENVYPAEIERVLMTSPKVRDAVVVRRMDEVWGEVPVAVVVAATADVTADELIASCAAQLAGYKRPKEVIFVAESRLPRSTTGKILRHEIEKWPEIVRGAKT